MATNDPFHISRLFLLILKCIEFMQMIHSWDTHPVDSEQYGMYHLLGTSISPSLFLHHISSSINDKIKSSNQNTPRKMQ